MVYNAVKWRCVPPGNFDLRLARRVCHSMKKTGYTLIELLVVIAIIAILAAMIMPVLLQAKETSRMRKCAQNMRQMGIAIQHYMDDYDGYSIPQMPRNDVVPEHPRVYENPWVLCVEPLLPNYLPYTIQSIASELPIEGTPQLLRGSMFHPPSRIWICPGDLVRGEKSLVHSSPFWYVCGSSYMYPGPTAYLSGKEVLDHGTKPRKPMDWKNPRRDMLLADYWPDFHTGKFEPHEFGKGSVMPKHLAQQSQFRNFNVLFLDMHMGTATLDQRMEYQRATITYDNPYWDGKDIQF